MGRLITALAFAFALALARLVPAELARMVLLERLVAAFAFALALVVLLERLIAAFAFALGRVAPAERARAAPAGRLITAFARGAMLGALSGLRPRLESRKWPRQIDSADCNSEGT